MSNELTVRNALPIQKLSELHELGKVLAQTSMFGTNNPAEGMVIAAMCHQQGITFIEYMQTYHLIKGRVSKRADAIAADFQRGGGKMVLVQRDAAGAVVTLEKGDSRYTSSCLWDDCLGEPFVYEGRESDVLAQLAAGKRDALKIKSKYATPRSRMQMLWARAISDGVRAVDPASVQGVYTPEEIGDFDEHRVAVTTRITPEQAEQRARTVEGVIVEDAPINAPAAAGGGATAPQTQRGEPTPFDLMPGAVDCSTCPMAGPMFGRPWAGMSAEHLKMAMTLTGAEMTDGHRAAIAALLASTDTENLPA